MSDLREGQVIRLADGRSAVVRFVGETIFAPGIWVGVELDDGNGKNDGSVQGERYFDCAMGNGMFVRPTAVTVIEQPKPKPKAAAVARKPSNARPNSMFTTGSARSTSGSVDHGVGRRRSLNAPSPSPGPRPSRAASIARVSAFLCLWDSGVPHMMLIPYLISLLPSPLRSNSGQPLPALVHLEPAPPQTHEGQLPPPEGPGLHPAQHERLWALLPCQHPGQAANPPSRLHRPDLQQRGLRAVDFP